MVRSLAILVLGLAYGVLAGPVVPGENAVAEQPGLDATVHDPPVDTMPDHLLGMDVATPPEEGQENADVDEPSGSNNNLDNLTDISDAQQVLNENVLDELQKDNEIAEDGRGWGVASLPAHLEPRIEKLNERIARFLYQSDIVLTTRQRAVLNGRGGRFRRKAYRDRNYPLSLWNVGPVGYTLDSSLTSNARRQVYAAVSFWQKNTCIRFEENGGGRNRIRFFAGQGCYSGVGRNLEAGEQGISIGKGCDSFGLAAHELAHALGFWHEQSRYDRNGFVSIFPENIQSGQAHNFAAMDRSQMSVYGLSYDHGSVMHYFPTAFSKNGRPTITSRDPNYHQTIGSVMGPSFLDVKMMNMHYSCTDRCNGRAINCKNGGYPNPNKCDTCSCPLGFGGADCTQPEPATNAVCGGSLYTSSSWQSLAYKVGDGNNSTVARFPVFCSWHVKPASGRRVEIYVHSLSGYCKYGCDYDTVEVKIQSDPATTGPRQVPQAINCVKIF